MCDTLMKMLSGSEEDELSDMGMPLEAEPGDDSNIKSVHGYFPHERGRSWQTMCGSIPHGAAMVQPSDSE